MRGRPEFISQENFRGYFSPTRMNKLFRVGGVLPGSFIAREKRNGKPFNPRGNEYRVIDIIARAWGQNLAVTPPEKDEIRNNIEDLRYEMEYLQKELTALKYVVENKRHDLSLSSASNTLTGKSLLREQEIVAGGIELGSTSGVYFLINRKQVVYVGQSVDVGSRVRQHVGAKEFTKYAFIPCPQNILNQLESLYIHTLRPPLNGGSSNSVSAPIRLDDLLSLGTK